MHAATNGTTKPAQQTLKPPSRMTLAGVVKGKLDTPLKVLLYGLEGCGKSTFAANAPKPIFIGAEDGTSHLDVARFPKPESLGDVFEAIRVLATEQHDYETAVVDTLDWLEPLIWREVIANARDKEKPTSIEEVGGGYGKGYIAAVDEWRKLLSWLERLQATKRMHVVLLAHSFVKNFKNPEGPDYDRYQIKLHEKSAGAIKEWCDAVLFAKHEELAHVDNRKRVRGVTTGARIIRTERTAAYDAKNRYSLPDPLPLSWTDFFDAVKAGRVADPKALREEIARKAKELGAELEKTVLETLAKAGEDPQRLALLNNRVNAKLADLAASQEAASAAEKVN